MDIFEYFSGCAIHTFLTNKRKNVKYYTIEFNRGIMCRKIKLRIEKPSNIVNTYK